MELKIATRCRAIAKMWNELLKEYRVEGFRPAIKVWNPLMNCYIDLADHADKLYRLAMSGYAFGYTYKTDKDGRLKNLSSTSLIHQGKALWINWGGRHFIAANGIVIFDVEQFEFQKIKIVRAPNQHFQNLVLTEGNLMLVGYELKHLGVVNLMCKVDIIGLKIIHWKSIVENRTMGILFNPSHATGDDLLIIYEKIRRVKKAKHIMNTEIEVAKLNLLTYQLAMIFHSEWPYDMAKLRTEVAKKGERNEEIAKKSLDANSAACVYASMKLNHKETEEEENREQRKLELSYREPKLLQDNIKVTFGKRDSLQGPKAS
ncbi:hypothetical protein PIB30_091712 [Stylosanthes scabra]|uniref:Uncharacterized protein n=1 Tax=Stylosanthes scabra TaxID=79078 RepID=A0ABU6SV20_9FABA|nr:hypothetical protein [Stylosanthes scabra]